MNQKEVQLSQMMQISNHGHILYVYEAIDSYVENAISYITTGIEHGHHLLIIDSKERFELIYFRLKELLSVEKLDYIHYVDNYEFYRLYEDFHCETIVNHFTEILNPFLVQNISIRTWAHVEWKEQDNIYSKIKKFENMADQSVNATELISVCAYDGNQISASLQSVLLRNHEYFMTDSELVKSNLYKKRDVIFPTLSVQEEHKRIEGKLKATKLQLESFIMQNLDPVLIFNNDERLITVNHAFERTFGWSANEVLGLNAHTLPFIPDDRKFEVNRNRGFVESGESIEGYETIRKTKSDITLNVMLSCFPLRDEENKYNGWAVIIRDISDRKQAQELLIKSEKLSIAGELAAGIAHEIRNPITSIKGFLQLLQSGSIEKKTYYNIISSEIDRIELILSELLMLAKPQSIKFKSKNISLLIKNVIALLEGHANMKNVQILTKFDSDETFVNCEENQIKQVCINFIKNAIEAMPNGGELLIQIKSINKEKLLICFIDQGCGIPKDLLSKLGQPFYTTKEKGTGLGFMVSKKIIENHKGSVAIASEENKGTTIEITLPLKEYNVLNTETFV
jgi:PAS domain S-box-containing protein